MSDDQIRNLRDWLRSNSDVSISAIPYLAKFADEVLRDGRVTSENRHEFRLAVERVLPPHQRDLVKLKRRVLEADERAEAKRARLAERERAREYARLSRPRSFNFMVAGTAYEGRTETIRTYVMENERVFLLREPSNVKDANAIKIGVPVPGQKIESELQTDDIGYVPRDVAKEMAPLLDAGYSQFAVCTKILRYARNGPIPIIDVTLYHPGGNAPAEALHVKGRISYQNPLESARPGVSTEPRIPLWPILLLFAILAIVGFMVAK